MENNGRTGTPGTGADLPGDDDEIVRVGLFVEENFPLAPLSLVIESLRLANAMLGRKVFVYEVVSTDGAGRCSSSALPVKVDHSVASCPPLEVLLVCTGQNSNHITAAPVLNWLRKSYRWGTRVGAISGGAFVLANAGLLQGRTCAVHWESSVALAEAFSDITVSGEIFVIDGRIITCAGGISTLDLMLHLIETFRGRAVARRVADDLIYPSIRGGSAPARIELRRRTGVSNTVLLRAIEMMENNLEQPIKLSEISTCLGTSMRHLERLFARAFEASPSQYYMRLRLREARGLLTQTDISIVEVALRCGFQNTSHFARRYRDVYKHLPSETRRITH